MNFKIIISLSIIFSISLQISCSSKNTKDPSKSGNNIISIDTLKQITGITDTTVFMKYDSSFVVKTIVKYPDPHVIIKGNILMLHGWNHPSTEWCNKTSFCNKALEEGYVLIMPDYEKSNYTLAVYPETINDYKKYPTLTWIINYHIPSIQEQLHLLEEGQNNYLAGISTGARGATLLAYHMPVIFKGVASLSGDFDITGMPDEFLYYSFLGHYNNFSDRWRKECFAFDCKNYNVPTYIGHGEKDKMSPVLQSKNMYDSIKKYNPEIPVIGNFPLNEEHTYDYWKSETDNILTFFNKLSI